MQIATAVANRHEGRKCQHTIITILELALRDQRYFAIFNGRFRDITDTNQILIEASELNPLDSSGFTNRNFLETNRCTTIAVSR